MEIEELNGKIEKAEERYRELSNKKNIFSRSLDKLNIVLLIFIGCSGLGSLFAIASGSSLMLCASLGLWILDFPLHLIRDNCRKNIEKIDKELMDIDNNVRNYQSDLYNLEVNKRIESEKREILNSRLYNREIITNTIKETSSNKKTFTK